MHAYTTSWNYRGQAKGSGRSKAKGNGKGKSTSGKRVWVSKGSIILDRLMQTEATGTARLYGAPLSADEYLLSQMAAREDDRLLADRANLETFGESKGWDAEDMLARQSGVEGTRHSGYAVGTCGFMGVASAKYASQYSVVELNCTFHDRGNKTYEVEAAKYAQLGMRVVVKVSGYATHDAALDDPVDWWPWLRSKYAPFVNAGVLIGILWQMPPSFTNTDETLARLENLGKIIRAECQTMAWLSLHHVFEFRDSSWFGDDQVTETCQRYKLCIARLHVVNDTGWAGDLCSGWHGGETASSGDFTYVRCFGSHGRSVGKYSTAELHDIAQQVRLARAGVVMFGQGDAPSQALSNAQELQEILTSGSILAASEQWLASDAPECARANVVSGKVVAVTYNRDKRVIIDVGGRRGFLGSRHIRKRGLQFQVGMMLDNLRVEGEERGWLVLSVCSGAKEQQ